MEKSELNHLLVKEESRYRGANTSIEKIGILYNLILLRNHIKDTSKNYREIKQFIEVYIEVIKTENYGYDEINQSKIKQLIQLLPLKERLSALQYAIIVMTRELPEYDKTWIIDEKKSTEINYIFKEKRYNLFVKGFFLFVGMNFIRVFFVLFCFIMLVNIILLPAPYECFSVFILKYEYYSELFILNHFLNVLSLICDIDNDFTITPTNWVGILLIILGKIFFVLIFVNFLYLKITEKIAVK